MNISYRTALFSYKNIACSIDSDQRRGCSCFRRMETGRRQAVSLMSYSRHIRSNKRLKTRDPVPKPAPYLSA